MAIYKLQLPCPDNALWRNAAMVSNECSMCRLIYMPRKKGGLAKSKMRTQGETARNQLRMLLRRIIYCDANHRYRPLHSPRPSLSASRSTRSGDVLVDEFILFADTATSSENPGTIPGWLIPGERLGLLVASFSLRAGVGALRCLGSVGLLAATPPAQGIQPAHLPSLDNPDCCCCCCCCGDSFEGGDRRPFAGSSAKLSRRRALLLLALSRDINGRAVTMLLPVTDEADPGWRMVR